MLSQKDKTAAARPTPKKERETERAIYWDITKDLATHFVTKCALQKSLKPKVKVNTLRRMKTFSGEPILFLVTLNCQIKNYYSAISVHFKVKQCVDVMFGISML